MSENNQTENNISTFMEVVKHRLTSPFYGTFILAWLVINRKTWYVTFFVAQENLGEGITNKIDYISSLYLNTNICLSSMCIFSYKCVIQRLSIMGHSILMNILYPLIVTLLILLLDKFANWYAEQKHKAIIKRREKEDDITYGFNINLQKQNLEFYSELIQSLPLLCKLRSHDPGKISFLLKNGLFSANSVNSEFEITKKGLYRLHNLSRIIKNNKQLSSGKNTDVG